MATTSALDIIDVANPSAFSLRGSFATPSNGAALDVTVNSGVAYVAAGTAGLLAVNVNNPWLLSNSDSWLPPDRR